MRFDGVIAWPLTRSPGQPSAYKMIFPPTRNEPQPASHEGYEYRPRFSPDGTFRAGIRFRTNSPIQLDRDETEHLLETLEGKIANPLNATAT